jgi:hypothetical protein
MLTTAFRSRLDVGDSHWRSPHNVGIHDRIKSRRTQP